MNLPLSFIERNSDQKSGNPPVLIMLHGYGSNEEDLYSMHPYIDSKFHIISLQAPLEMNYGGYAWFPIEYTPNGVVVDLAEAKKSLEQLKTVVQFIHTHTKPDKLFLMGFSQGTIMSLGAALHLPNLISGVLGFSGRFERKMLPEIPDMPAIRKLAVFQSHGISDPVIPVTAGRDAKKILEEYGVNLTYKEYPFAHEISGNCLKDSMLWLKEQMAVI